MPLHTEQRKKPRVKSLGTQRKVTSQMMQPELPASLGGALSGIEARETGKESLGGPSAEHRVGSLTPHSPHSSVLPVAALGISPDRGPNPDPSHFVLMPRGHVHPCLWWPRAHILLRHTAHMARQDSLAVDNKQGATKASVQRADIKACYKEASGCGERHSKKNCREIPKA